MGNRTSATPTPQYYVLGMPYTYIIGNAITERILEQLYNIITDIRQEARKINFVCFVGLGAHRDTYYKRNSNIQGHMRCVKQFTLVQQFK